MEVNLTVSFLSHHLVPCGCKKKSTISVHIILYSVFGII